MRTLSRFAVFLASVLPAFGLFVDTASAGIFDDILKPAGTNSSELNVRQAPRSGQSGKNDYLEGFGSSFSDRFFRASSTGERGAYNFITGIGRDVKNVFIAVAVIYLVISVLRILFSAGGEEDLKKWKTSILWTSLGIVVMQTAYVFVSTLYNKDITGRTADLFLDKIVYPFVNLLGMFASFAFLAMAFLAFFRLVSSGGDEEKAKTAKRSIIAGIIGFMIIKIPKALVESIYGKVQCDHTLLFGICRLEDPNLSATVSIMTNVVNYVNGFLGIVTVLLIIYAGWLVLSSGGDEEKVKKAKGILKYIFIGVFLLVTSYVLFNFFVLKG
jgi:hypothetical protein